MLNHRPRTSHPRLFGHHPAPLRADAAAAGPTAAYRVVASIRFPIRLVFRPRSRGLENVPANGGYVLAPNQVSNLDGVAFGYTLFPRQLRWLGKAELFRPVVAPLLGELGIVPVRRGAGDFRALATAVALARAGNAVGIFPEGTRRHKGFHKTRQARPHTGAARIALAAGVPLVPAAIAGTERLTLLRRWRVAFGPPVSVEGLDPNPRLAARQLTARLMEAIAELEAELAETPPSPPRRLHPRHRIDVAARDILFALQACLTARRRGRERRVLGAWAGGASGMVCLSVRSGLDLLLGALALAPGDEVAVSAVTHPDMIRIIEAHGLRALPVDIDVDTLAPRLEALEHAVGPRTRVILVAHLFGSSVDLGPIAALARRHGLMLVEDCAQSFRGPHDAGDPLADVSLFSFGSIKTATALGGALVRVDDAAVLSRMRELNGSWPVQGRGKYARRVLRFGVLMMLSRPRVYSLFARLLASAGSDLDTVVNRAVRGFPDDRLAAGIRRQPSAPLLALLERRLRRFDDRRITLRAEAGERVAKALPTSVERVGRNARMHSHWLLPVVSQAPDELVASLRRAGFDASARTSAITDVQPPDDRADLAPADAQRLMQGVVFLPAYPELAGEADALAEAVAAGGAS